MINPELGIPIVSGAIVLGFYIYLLNERRKLIASRERRRQHPAE